MKRLGTIEDVSYRGMLIVRTGTRPRVGSKVLDRRRNGVGRIVGLMGPVTRPFVLIEPLRVGGRGAELMGLTVFLP